MNRVGPFSGVSGIAGKSGPGRYHPAHSRCKLSTKAVDKSVQILAAHPRKPHEFSGLGLCLNFQHKKINYKSMTYDNFSGSPLGLARVESVLVRCCG